MNLLYQVLIHLVTIDIFISTKRFLISDNEVLCKDGEAEEHGRGFRPNPRMVERPGKRGMT